MATTSAAMLYAWGNAAGGRLGDGTTTSTRLSPTGVTPPNVTLSSVVAGHDDSTIAIDTNRHVWAVGRLTGHAAASSDFVEVGITDAAAVALSYNNAAAVTRTGSLYLWGDNGSGQLGNGTTTTPPGFTPQLVTGIPALRAVALTYYSTIAVTTNGEIWTWGGNSDGLLGDGTFTQRSTPRQITRPSGMGLVRDVQGVYSHVVALTQDGQLWAWGTNSAGELGAGTAGSARAVPVRVATPAGVVFDKVAVSPFYAIARDTTGRFWSWGALQGDIHQYSVPAGVVDVDTGYYYQLLRRSNGTVLGVGDNSVGQLGDGTTIDRATPVPVAFSRTAGPIGVVSAGGTHSLAIPGAVVRKAVSSLTILQLGDSYSAGNGALGPDGSTSAFYGPTKCYRSSSNWGSQYSDYLRSQGIRVRYINRACSGAVSEDIVDSNPRPSVTVSYRTEYPGLTESDPKVRAEALQHCGTKASGDEVRSVVRIDASGEVTVQVVGSQAPVVKSSRRASSGLRSCLFAVCT